MTFIHSMTFYLIRTDMGNAHYDQTQFCVASTSIEVVNQNAFFYSN